MLQKQKVEMKFLQMEFETIYLHLHQLRSFDHCTKTPNNGQNILDIDRK
jgi:hypothetical protein